MIAESIKSLSPCPEDVGTLPILVKYCVDCFSPLFLCSCHVGYISGCISLRLVGGFLREVVVLRTTESCMSNIKGISDPISINIQTLSVYNNTSLIVHYISLKFIIPPTRSTPQSQNQPSLLKSTNYSSQIIQGQELFTIKNTCNKVYMNRPDDSR